MCFVLGWGCLGGILGNPISKACYTGHFVIVDNCRNVVCYPQVYHLPLKDAVALVSSLVKSHNSCQDALNIVKKTFIVSYT